MARIRPPLLSLLLAAVAAAMLGCVSFADLARREEETPPAARCGECHGAVYEEWRASPHAATFTSPAFLARTDGGTVQRCVPCHAPAPMPASTADRPPAARAGRREEGVHCLACHQLAAGHGDESSAAMFGPLAPDALVQPHPIQELASWYRDARFCGRCHQDTLAEWQASGQAVTCQQCHMPAVHRKVTQATGLVSKALVAFEEEQELRAHDFSAAAARLEAANVLGGGFIAVRGVATRDQPALRLVNRLPHALPTGGFGAGTVRIEIHVPAAAPIVRTLSTRPGMALAPGAALDVALPDEARGSGVQVEVLRVTSDGAPLLLWRGEVPVPAKGREDSPP